MDTKALVDTDGIGRNVLEVRLRAAAFEIDRLRAQQTWNDLASREYIDCLHVVTRERVQLLDQVQAVQTRCTELLDEARANRRIAGAPPGELHVLGHISHERRLQDEKWGPLAQHLDVPDGTGSAAQIAECEAARHACQRAEAFDFLTWADVLREETAEALAEADPKRLRAELVQVGAVVVKWIELLDLRAARLTTPSPPPEDPSMAAPSSPTDFSGLSSDEFLSA